MGRERRRRRQHMQSDDRRRYQELTTAVARNQTRDFMGYPTNPSGAAFGGITEAVSAVSQQEGDEVTLGVLKRQVPWDTYQKADLISDRESSFRSLLPLISRWGHRHHHHHHEQQLNIPKKLVDVVKQANKEKVL